MGKGRAIYISIAFSQNYMEISLLSMNPYERSPGILTVGTGDHLTNFHLEYRCLSLLSVVPTLLCNKEASQKPGSPLMCCQILQWGLCHYGGWCLSALTALGEGQHASETHRPSSISGGTLQTMWQALESAPGLPCLCLFFSLSFSVRWWLSQGLPLLKGLSRDVHFRVTFIKISYEFNISHHCLILFR